MPVPSILPKGCSVTRGVADAPHISQHGSLTQAANRMYMLNVRRVSLSNKRKATAARLEELTNQLRAIEIELSAIEKKYGGLKGNRGLLRQRRMKRGASRPHEGNGPVKKPMALKY